MPLNGVNKLCASCKKSCKQWKQVTIVRCAYGYEPKDAKSSKVHLDPEQKS